MDPGVKVPVSSQMRATVAGDIRNPARTSLPVSGGVTVLTDAGQQYFSPPKILEAQALDLLNNDTAFGMGDMIRLLFDRETNGMAERKQLINRTYVDQVLAFYDAVGAPFMLPLGASYSGEWEDTRTLTITFGTGTSNTTAPAVVEVRETAGLLTRAGVSTAASDRRTLTGDFGSFEPPAIRSFVARDVRSAGFGYNRGDELLVGFDRPTDRGRSALPLQGGRAFVDEVFLFSHQLGADYSGAWFDASTFGVTILDSAGASPPVVGFSTVQVKTTRICNAAGIADSCTL
eukprot:2258724-Prymnesium_polylepis.1